MTQAYFYVALYLVTRSNLKCSTARLQSGEFENMIHNIKVHTIMKSFGIFFLYIYIEDALELFLS